MTFLRSGVPAGDEHDEAILESNRTAMRGLGRNSTAAKDHACEKRRYFYARSRSD
jgi:hypothetical protein